MQPIEALEYLADIDSVEGEILDGNVLSAEAWAVAAGDIEDWLMRMN